jgi:DNA-binding NtrC family response regulator
VFSFTMPPLRVRKGDVPLLAEAFVAEFAGKYDRAVKALSAEALETLGRHGWPGNVRELRNCIERAVVSSTGVELTGDLLPLEVAPLPAEFAASAPAASPALSLDGAERLHILRTLAALANNKTRTAESLGISLKTLHNKLRRYRQSPD